MGKRTLGLNSIHPTALIDATARIGKGTRVWAFVQIAEGAVVGEDCMIANGAYIDRHVQIGSRVRIHNKALLYQGAVIKDSVFIGPGVCLANDRFPRSGKTRPLKDISWTIEKGASIGANAVVLPDVTIGAYALVGAGSVVTRDVAAHTVVCGNPAKPIGWACACGAVLKKRPGTKIQCPDCVSSKHSKKNDA